MVEDEFYAVAQSFTQHLHYAEYAKRKKEVKLQNAAAIQNLARPTDGVTPVSDVTRRRDAADALSARQKAGLEQIQSKRPRVDSEEENEEVEDEIWFERDDFTANPVPLDSNLVAQLLKFGKPDIPMPALSERPQSSCSETGRATLTLSLRTLFLIRWRVEGSRSKVLIIASFSREELWLCNV
ncbi:hypothetical protein APSETT444_003012 [Aspergillus pseudonomiae]